MNFKYVFSLLLLIGCSGDKVVPYLKYKDSEYSYFYENFRNVNHIKSIMQKDANFDINSMYGDEGYKTTLLHWAAYNNDLDMIKFLLSSGAKLNALDDFLAIPFTQTNDPEIAKFFIKNGVDINSTSYMCCFTLLHCSVMRGDVEMVKFCLKHGANINATTCNSIAETPLCTAFECLGMKPMYKDSTGKSSYFINKVKPSNEKYFEIIKILVKNGADVNKTCNLGNFSPLKAAIATGNKDIINIMISHGAK